jgi:hypothetical protein
MASSWILEVRGDLKGCECCRSWRMITYPWNISLVHWNMWPVRKNWDGPIPLSNTEICDIENVGFLERIIRSQFSLNLLGCDLQSSVDQMKWNSDRWEVCDSMGNGADQQQSMKDPRNEDSRQLFTGRLVCEELVSGRENKDRWVIKLPNIAREIIGL